jgi:hypothetical protein
MYGLFQTDARRGPVSDAVAKIWRTNAVNSGAPTRTAASYFPRERTIASLEPSGLPVAPPVPVAAVSQAGAPSAVAPVDVAATGSLAPAPLLTNVPLPPPRPRTDTLQVQSAAGAAPAGNPLNLLAYTKPRRS